MKKILSLLALSCIGLGASAEVTPQHKHVYTIKGAFSGPTYRPIYYNETAARFKSANGENGATPQKFVFFSSNHSNTQNFATFKVGVVEGDGYIHYDPNNNGKVTKNSAADIAFPTSSTTLATRTWEVGGVAAGYNGMIGIDGTDNFRSYVVQNNTNINYNTRSAGNAKVYAKNTLGATSSWEPNFLIEEVPDYDVYDVAFVNGAAGLTVSYTGTSECLTTTAQSDGGYFVLATGASKTAADFGNTLNIPATVSVDESTKTITFTFPDAVNVTYRYTNNGQTWYTESGHTGYAGVTVTTPTLLPYGVTVNSLPVAPEGGGEVEIPVTYTKGGRGFDFSADYEHAKWHKWYKRYSWQNTVRSELFYVEEANYINQNKDNTNNTSDEYLWAAVGNPFDFVIINRAAGRDKYLSNPNATVGDANEPYMQEQSAKTQHYYLYNCTNAGNTWGDMNFTVINASTRTTLSGNGRLNYWVNNNAWGDDGSRMIWEWVMDEPEGIPVTFNYTSNQGASWSIEKLIEIGHSLEESDYAVDFYNNYSVSPNTPVSSTNITFNITCDDNFPFTPGQPCRMQTKRDVSLGGDFYVHTDGNAYAKEGVTSYEDNKNVWVIEHAAGTPDIFTVRSFYNNKYLTLLSTTTAGQASLQESPVGTSVAPFNSEMTSYFRVKRSTHPETLDGFCLTHPKREQMCMAIHYQPTNSSTTGYGVGGWGNGDVDRKDNAVFVYSIESFTTTLAAAAEEGNYGSIYLPYTMTLPEGVEAYTAAKDGEVLKLTKVGEFGTVIPAGAYILYSEEASSANLALGEGATTTADDNELTGQFKAGVALPAGSNYVLNKKNDEVGFYKYSKTTYPVAKAVLCAGSSASKAAIAFDFDDVVTAIDAIHHNNSQAEIFDLQGRRLNKAQQGMNIINGHKVLVK